jgi:hypothetical protein
MNRKPPSDPQSTDEQRNWSFSEDCFLDLKRLSQRTCMSVRGLRYHINDHSRTLPVYRVRGKILVSWIEFKKWIQAFRRKNVDIDKILDEVMGSLRR